MTLGYPRWFPTMLASVATAAFAVAIATLPSRTSSAATPNAATTAPGPTAQSPRWRLGYFPYYQQSQYPPAKVDFSRLTHIATGNVWPTAGGCCAAASGDARSWARFATDMNTRAHQYHRTTILQLGGSDSKSAVWISNTATPEATAHFAAATKAYAQRLHYDGVDLDWETDLNPTRLARFAAALRSVWPNAVLAVPTGPFGFAGTEKVAPYVNQVNIMSYIGPGNWGGWDGPWHQSPLFGDTTSHPYSIDRGVKVLEKLGVPAAKIGIGVGFSGDGWSDTSPVDGKCPTGPTDFGGEQYGPTSSDSDLPLSKVDTTYLAIMTRKWDATAHVPYLVAPSTSTRPAGVGSPKLCYISYDDQQSLTEKGNYVKANGLGGVIIWTVPQGYDAAKGTNDPLVWVANAFN